MARKREPEHVEQKQLFRWVALHEARFPALKYLYAVPNGRGRAPAEAGKLKAEGVKRGVPDVALDVARHGFHGLRIEMKAPGEIKDVSEEQRDWQAHLVREGYLVYDCDSWQDAWKAIVEYLGRPDLAVKGPRALT